MMRFDMDALPIQEEKTRTEYRSQVPENSTAARTTATPQWVWELPPYYPNIHKISAALSYWFFNPLKKKAPGQKP